MFLQKKLIFMHGKVDRLCRDSLVSAVSFYFNFCFLEAVQTLDLILTFI